MSDEKRRIKKIVDPTDDVNFLIICEPDEYNFRFRCYENLVFDKEVMLPRKGELSKMSNPVDSIAEIDQAEVFLSGWIKWDGCSDINFDVLEDCQIHSCGRKDAGRIGKLIDKLYDLAPQMIDHWDDELGNGF